MTLRSDDSIGGVTMTSPKQIECSAICTYDGVDVVHRYVSIRSNSSPINVNSTATQILIEYQGDVFTFRVYLDANDSMANVVVTLDHFGEQRRMYVESFDTVFEALEYATDRVKYSINQYMKAILDSNNAIYNWHRLINLAQMEAYNGWLVCC